MKIAIKPNLVTKAAADLLKRGLTVVYHKTSNNACPKGLFKNYVGDILASFTRFTFSMV